MASENQLITWASARIPSAAGRELRLGIGDDAAILRPLGHLDWVATSDAFLEGVHFLLDIHPPAAVGYKALARATSDIAAMGARPSLFFMNVALPPARAGSWYKHFLTGMGKAARNFGLRLAGGDTTKSPCVHVNLTILGEVPAGKAILRSGARPGDLICVSGRLGEAELGLRLIQLRLQKKEKWRKFVRKHLQPEPRLELGKWLQRSGLASAMIDTSDGLSTDLGHVCSASRVGATVWATKIPSVVVPVELQHSGVDPSQLGIHGGDDYELLFTVPRRKSNRLPADFHGLPLTIIGEITTGKRVVLVDGSGHSERLHAGGWDPFRASSKLAR